MAEPDRRIKRGTLFPPLTGTAEATRNGVTFPLDLTPFVSIELVLHKAATGTTPPSVIRGPVELLDGPGRWQYVWVEGDTAVMGVYRGELKGLLSDGRRQAIPDGNDPAQTFFTVEIIDDLG